MSHDTRNARPPEEAREFIVFGSDWNRHPSTSQHLARGLLPDSQVIWVETVGLRAPSLTWRDIKRCGQKLLDFCTTRRETTTPDHPHLHVLSPPTLPFTRLRAVRRFNLWSVKNKVRRAARALGFEKPVLVLTCPHQGDYVGHMQESCSIYLCLDDYSLWHGMDAVHVTRMEQDILGKVDAIVTVSARLAERLGGPGRRVQVISQGVDVHHFSSRTRAKSGGPFEIVYFGMIDARLDQDLLLRVAHSLPDARIRLIGPQVADTRRLAAAANIHVEAGVSYDLLPESIASADVFILPFLVNPLTESCTPLKLKEYLATGKPVVSTPNPTASEWGRFVQIASSHDEFIQRLESIAAHGEAGHAPQLQESLERETWAAKTTEFLALVNEVRSSRLSMS